MTNPVLAFLPPFIWVLSTWKIARLGGLAYFNYQEKVNETVAITIKEQIRQQYVDPFLSSMQTTGACFDGANQYDAWCE